MVTAKEPRASEGNHWYTTEGLPMYTVESLSGAQRPTTMRDARKKNLVPSVTTILNVAAKPGLVIWIQRQVLMSSLTLPRFDGEPENEFIARIMDDSKEQGRKAADAGTDIHTSVQGFYEGIVMNKHKDHVQGCVTAIRDAYGEQPWVAERSFAHELGFGGKCDLHVPATDDHTGLVVDIKTKEFSDPSKVEAFEENLMQLAAYRVGLGMPNARCANVMVSRSAPGLAKVIEWPEADLKRGWLMFHHLLSFWVQKNEFKI